MKEHNIDETFAELVDVFNERLRNFNISQDEIDELSQENGYYPAEKIINVSYDKELKLFTLMEHHNEISHKINDIKWQLSAMNKLIKDYKTFM